MIAAIFLFIIELVLAVALIGAIAQKRAGGAVGVAVLAVIAWIAFSFTQVDANTQSVRLSLGKPTGDVLPAGPHLVAPWTTGATFSTLNQWIRFRSHDNKAKDEATCVNTRLARQSMACIDGIVYYTQPNEHIDELFATWRSEDRIRNLWIMPKLQQALGKVLGSYDPLASATQDADALTKFSDQVTEQLAPMLPQLTGVRVDLSNMDYDDPTEENLKQVTAALAKTRVATQDLQTAQQVAAANKTIAESLRGDAVTAYYRCVQLFNETLRDVRPQTIDMQAPCATTIGVLK